MIERFLPGRKVGGMRVVRIGPFTLMLCRRSKSAAERRHEASKRAAKRIHQNYLARVGAKYLWDLKRIAEWRALEPYQD